MLRFGRMSIGAGLDSLVGERKRLVRILMNRGAP